jgi:phospholipid/cholesterol/gamma-HCH transport system substrate-binding protein
VRTLGPAFKVGLTFLLVSIASYYAFMMLAKGGCAGEPDQLVLHAHFHDATLIVEKSRVQIAGLNVGHIISRELNVRPPRPELVAQKRFAKITLALNRDVTLYSNAIVYKRSASLLGEFYLEVDPGTYEWTDADGKVHRGEVLGDGDEIRRVVEAATAGGVVQQVSDMMPVVKELIQDVRRFTSGPLLSIGNSVNDGINENRQAIRQIVSNMESITRDIRMVASAAGTDVRDILADVRDITSDVREIMGGQAGRSGADGETEGAPGLKQGMQKLAAATDKLDRALDDVSEITGGLREGKGNIGRLLRDEELIDDVEEVVRDTGDLIKSFSGLQTVVGLRSEYNFQAGTIKTYVSIELRPRPDKFYLIELIDDPRGRRDQSTILTRSDDPSRPLFTREDRVVLSDAFRITFQFAKRIRFSAVDLTFRMGIKESTGGVGVDLHFLDDQLMIWTDAFDAQANLYPRLKVLAAWQFFKRLYLVGGIDDVLNERPRDGTGGGRDYFLGLQLRFNDQDLLQLLLFGGSALSGSTSGG